MTLALALLLSWTIVKFMDIASAGVISDMWPSAYVGTLWGMVFSVETPFYIAGIVWGLVMVIAAGFVCNDEDEEHL